MPVKAADKMPRDHQITVAEHELWYEGPDYKLLLLRVWIIQNYQRGKPPYVFCHSPDFTVGRPETIYDVTYQGGIRGQRMETPKDVARFWSIDDSQCVSREEAVEFAKRKRLDLGKRAYAARLKRPAEPITFKLGVTYQGWVRGVAWQAQVIDSLSQRVSDEDRDDR